MKLARTRLFETVHPMTYFFVIKSVVWGLFVLFSLIAFGDDLFPGHTPIWPEPVAYAWCILVIGLGLLELWYLLQDYYHSERENVWNLAKANLAVWAFSPVLWVVIGAYSMLIISVFACAGYSYIALAKKFHRPGHRI